MTSVRREFFIKADPMQVWDAVQDVASVHTRLAPGFVTNTCFDGAVRIVTFDSGPVVRERIVDVDHQRRRLCYSAVGGRAAHHNASIEVLAAGNGRTMLVWITDVLPHDVGDYVAVMMDRAILVIRLELERNAAGSVARGSAP